MQHEITDFNMNFFSLKGKNAIVTGGNSGLGQAFALALAKAGANILCPSIMEDDGTTKKLIEAEGVRFEFMLADITQEGVCAKVVDTCVERLGSVDILVNCAGTQYRAPALDFPVEEFDRVMNVNNRAVFIMSKLAAENMMPRGYGKIINIASMQSFFGIPNTPAYAASKGAVAQLTKSLGNEWIEKGINVNALAPGWIATKLTKGVTEDPVRTQEIMGRLPAKRWGYPSDFKGPVIFLASAASDYLSGVILPVDGGYLTR